jgi:hypothetical protein
MTNFSKLPYRNVSESLTASMMMTPRKELFFFKLRDKASYVLEEMEAHNFDIAPVTENGNMQWFVQRETLKTQNSSLRLKEVAESIMVKHVISEQSRIEELLDLLTRQDFFFVIGKKEVTGLITYADLNKRPVKLLFYLLISELEARLIEMIKHRFPQIADSIKHLRPSQQKEIEGYLKGSRRGDSEISVEQYFSTSHVMTIVVDDSTLREQLGYHSKKQARKNLDPIVTLRNKIMHPRSLIKDREETKKLKQKYDLITDLLKTACENTRY